MLTAGVARTGLTPFWGVELTGWGYYIQRRWKTVHDPLYATALAVDDGRQAAIVITLDLMVIDTVFTERTRQRIADEIPVSPSAIMLTCSHSHNAPAAGGLLGVGQCDPVYEDWASRQAATAAIVAWNNRQSATMRTAQAEIHDLTYNRTRPHGSVDPHLVVAAVDCGHGSPLAVLVNFAGHPTIATEKRPWAVSRDLPGQVCDALEQALPGTTALYLQGACGDVNFLPELATAQNWSQPAGRIARAALDVLQRARPIDASRAEVAVSSRLARLPTRRWTEAEIMQDRQEAERRLRDRDFSKWREDFGRAMTNRPDDMVRRHGGDEQQAVRAMCRFKMEWTELMLKDYQQRPEYLDTEVQAVRIGDLCIAANASEFFSPFALNVRRSAAERSTGNLMLACYANGRIGYLPDEFDIQARSYAGYQSPKYCNQFPFTAQSGPAMCAALIAAIAECGDDPLAS
ncbi:MAG: hypothetical protein KF752_17535 [Pirellulaceae bacterium]|nr:hypothetical protein [Pirellulaceae bacterium]